MQGAPQAIRVGALVAAVALVALVAAAAPATAAVTIYEEGDVAVEVGGNIQLQYRRVDPDGGASEDDLFFRRLRPSIEGTFQEDWSAKIEIDFGGSSSDNEVAVKDAWIGYGFEGADLRVGNAKPPFSREFLTSSKRQQLVERTFVGDHNYGAPDRILGVHLDGELVADTLAWGAAFGSASVDPDPRRLDFDTPVNRDADWNEGWLVAGRLDYFPLGDVRFAQADFDRGPLKLGLGLAAFLWDNDGDNNSYSSGPDLGVRPDIDAADGVEISAALRFRGLSVDAQHNRIGAETVLGRFDAGLYRNGETTLDVSAVEAGYLVVGDLLEVVGAWERLDADGYDEPWVRVSAGVNWYLDRHDLKLQLALRTNQDQDGIAGRDSDELFAQLQYVF